MIKLISDELSTKLYDMLNRAIETDRADMGNLQLYHEETQTLHIVAQKGFKQDFLDHFKIVRAFDASACGRAIGLRTTIIINDVTHDLAFAPHNGIATSAGFRAVKSVPLLSPDRQPLGVLSTHFKKIQWGIERDNLYPIIQELILLLQQLV